MKTLFSLFMLVLITVASIVSCRLFMKSHYDLSALLTLTSIVSFIMTVYVISYKRVRLS
jgi:hypothetical protein